jgi:hypothetical protein
MSVTSPAIVTILHGIERNPLFAPNVPMLKNSKEGEKVRRGPFRLRF